MFNKLSFILIFVLFSWASAYGQSSLVIFSADSSNFTLQTNLTEQIDSLHSEVQLIFQNQPKAYIQVKDSTLTEIYSGDVVLLPSITQRLTLQKTGDSWRLFPVASFDFTAEVVDSLLTENTEQKEPLVPVYSINSDYKSSNSLNSAAVTELKNIRFERDRIAAAKDLLQRVNLSKSEITQVLLALSYEDQRLMVLEEFADKISSKLSISDLDSLFELSIYRKKASSALKL